MLFDVCAGRHLSTRAIIKESYIMFTDHELLELAAIAAGLEPDKAEWTQRAGLVWIQRVDGIRKEFRWNPLTDDGDAFRLAVQLNISMDLCRWVQTAFYDVGAFVAEDWSNGGDAFAATRRAIVRAAAEIGRQMKKDNIS